MEAELLHEVVLDLLQPIQAVLALQAHLGPLAMVPNDSPYPTTWGLKKIRSLAFSEAELLHEELHHPLGTRHIVFGLHVDVSEKSFQDQSKASICPLCAKFHHPNPKNKKVMKIYSQISIKSNPLTRITFQLENT